MPSSWRLADVRRLAPLDRVLIATFVVLGVLSTIQIVAPDRARPIVAAGLDTVVDTVTTLVTLGVAVLTWARYRDQHEPVALAQSAAFVVLAFANAVALLLVVTQLDGARGIEQWLPGQAALYIASFSPVLAAALLVEGLRESLVGRSSTRLKIGIGVALAGVVVFLAFLQVGAGVLPPLSSPFDATVGPLHPALPGPLPVATPLGVLVRVIAASLFLWAAVLSRRLYLLRSSIGDGYLTVGFVIAAFSEALLAIQPGTYPGVVTGGDFLRVAFDVVLLLGIEAAARTLLEALRMTSFLRERVQESEAESAALEERARLARELHDGLAQDLWLAKLKVGRLAVLAEDGSEVESITGELERAVDNGLAEARQAVLALRSSRTSDTSFCDLLGGYLDDVADGFGLPIEFECERELPPMSLRVKAELLRIAQEALSNVRRHADATLVTIRVTVEGDRLALVVHDNGRGFDAASLGEKGFGLTSMRERASLVGGTLTVTSRPHDGTRVAVDVPLTLATSANLHVDRGHRE
ncbi:MAG: sensor histidine kinase [Candidatus Limnocylindria bacterium]